MGVGEGGPDSFVLQYFVGETQSTGTRRGDSLHVTSFSATFGFRRTF